jgi:hypothetical protein
VDGVALERERAAHPAADELGHHGDGGEGEDGDEAAAAPAPDGREARAAFAELGMVVLVRHGSR